MFKARWAVEARDSLVAEASRARTVREEVACKAAMLMYEAFNGCGRRKQHWASQIIDSCRLEDVAFGLRCRGSFGRTYH